ncbi:MAG TPA: hypothetical protein VFA11_04315 [Acidimicrobiales bacterium]|nr:hypothetical protein [Acidimicrobiales bacterium]
MSGRRRLLAVACGAPAAVVLLAGWVSPAGADASVKAGWWNEANMGVAQPPPPPGAPNGGLYVQNGPGGPVAISAVSFAVPSGANVQKLVLSIAGSPVITQPPVACPVSGSFTPEENGAWADRPTYDCSKTQVTGTVNSAQTSVSFDASQLLSGTTLAAVILAGGPADQIGFTAPDSNSLQVAQSSPTTPAADSPTAPDSGGAFPAPAPSDSSSGAPAAAPPVVSAFVSGGDSGGSAAVALPAPSTPTPPANAPSQPATSAARRPAYQPYSTSSGGSGFPRNRVATGLGLASVVIALAAFSQGYGPLGGRIQPLSIRGGSHRRRSVSG